MFRQVLFASLVLALVFAHTAEARRRRAQPVIVNSMFIDDKKSNFGLPYKVTHIAYMNISANGTELGQLRIGLFGETVPRTVDNFIALCKHSKGYGYVGSKFHRLIRGFILQGGDFTNGDGTGGHSIYHNKGHFEDENFLIPHGARAVAMANAGPNANGGQFFVDLDANSFLNGKHVVFGIVLAGYRTLVKQIEYKASVNATTDALLTDVEITAAGVEEDFEASTEPITPEHTANDDGTEGPKKVFWVPNPDLTAQQQQQQAYAQQMAYAQQQQAYQQQMYGRGY